MLTTPTERRNEEGFTLIELLVVIIIIGILAAIAIPIFMNQQKAAGDATLKSDLNTAAIAAKTWYVKNPNASKPSSANSVMGWQILQRGEGENVLFAGTAKDPAQAQLDTKVDGFSNFTPSPGVAIGIYAPPSDSTHYQQYCIVGDAQGSNYYQESDGSWNVLYYDSMYGILEADDLKEDGACGRYIGKVWHNVVEPLP